MDIVVDGDGRRPFRDADRKRIGAVRGPLPVSAAVLSVGEATDRIGRGTRALNIALAGVMGATVVAFVWVEATASDSFMTYGGLVLLPAMAVLGLAWRVALRRGDRLRRRMVDAAGISPAQGVSITAREGGLDIGPRQTPWEDINVSCVGVVISGGGDGPSHLIPDRLWLDVGGQPAHLDSRLIDNGAALVFAVYRRKVAT